MKYAELKNELCLLLDKNSLLDMAAVTAKHDDTPESKLQRDQMLPVNV